MMKLLGRLVLPSLLLIASSSSYASTGSSQSFTDSDSTSDLANYLLNLGGYLGYNLQTSPTSSGSSSGSSNAVSQNLLNLSKLQLTQNYLFNTWIGALLVNTATQNPNPFVPSNIPAYSQLNAFANYTFTTPPYASPSAEQVSVSTLVDQPPYQNDPVSQSVLNIIATPDFSYCLTNDGSAVTACSYSSGTLNNNQVMINTVGTIPSTGNYFAYTQVQPLLSQLNSNSLITPLMYTTTTSGSSTSSSSGTTTQSGQGLTAQTQALQAENFIRYATSQVLPLRMPNRNDYDTLYIRAQNASGSYTQLQQQQAQATLANYLTGVRVYTAQVSVAISNLYYIMSKRLPQNEGTGGSGQQTSQALSEFTMATWRLYNPDQSTNTQWLAQINQASAATVQKEIATLLAEINYQLYLTRQQQERLLLTNSMLLLQNAKTIQATTLSLSAAAAAVQQSQTSTLTATGQTQ